MSLYGLFLIGVGIITDIPNYPHLNQNQSSNDDIYVKYLCISTTKYICYKLENIDVALG